MTVSQSAPTSVSYMPNNLYFLLEVHIYQAETCHAAFEIKGYFSLSYFIYFTFILRLKGFNIIVNCENIYLVSEICESN